MSSSGTFTPSVSSKSHPSRLIDTLAPLQARAATGAGLVLRQGKSVTSLKARRYTIAVTDKSSTTGFMLQKLEHAVVNITGMTFVGKRSVTVKLTAGKWLVIPRLGKTTYSIVV